MTTPIDELAVSELVGSKLIGSKLAVNWVQVAKELEQLQEKKILSYLIRDKPLIEAFCQRYQRSLRGIDLNYEEGIMPSGLIYFFNDNLGGYSRRGLERSLLEISLVEEN